MHRDSLLIRSNKMQLYAGIYLLQNYCVCFGCPSHLSSGVHKTVTAASGTGHSVRATTFLQCGLIRPRWRKVVAQIRDRTCTRSCSYGFMYSWWWVWWISGTGFYTCQECHKTESLWNHTTTDHREGEQLEDRKTLVRAIITLETERTKAPILDVYNDINISS